MELVSHQKNVLIWTEFVKTGWKIMFELGYSVVLKDLMLETSSVRNIL